MVLAPTRIPTLAELALDPDVAPPRVLPGEAEDELADVRVDRRTSRLSPRSVDPLPPDELAVPPEQRLGRDEERGPSLTTHEPSGRGEENPVDRSEPRAPRLPAQDLQLVPKDRDLDVLRGLPTG